MPTTASPHPLAADLARLATIVLATTAALILATASASEAADAMMGTRPAGGVPQDSDNWQPSSRQGESAVRVQPSARQFAWPNRPDVDPTRAREVDELYRQLIDGQGSGSTSTLSDVNAR